MQPEDKYVKFLITNARNLDRKIQYANVHFGTLQFPAFFQAVDEERKRFVLLQTALKCSNSEKVRRFKMLKRNQIYLRRIGIINILKRRFLVHTVMSRRTFFASQFFGVTRRQSKINLHVPT